VNKQAFAALLLSLALGLALSSVSCVTCPAGQQSCGTSNADAGASNSDDTECDLLTAMRSCMDAYCKTASNPFCSCYNQGQDLTTSGCKCIDFSEKRFCDQAEQNGVDATTYDCAAASSGVSSYCVGVN